MCNTVFMGVPWSQSRNKSRVYREGEERLVFGLVTPTQRHRKQQRQKQTGAFLRSMCFGVIADAFKP